MTAQATADKIVSRQIKMAFAGSNVEFMTECRFDPSNPSMIEVLPSDEASKKSPVYWPPVDRKDLEHQVANAKIVNGKCKVKLRVCSREHAFDVNHQSIDTLLNMAKNADFFARHSSMARM